MRFNIRHLLIFFCVIFGFAQSVAAQQTIYDEATLLYKKEINGGIQIHGNGYGVFFTKSHQKTAMLHNRWNIEIVNMKHPKERKQFYSQSDNSKGFFFGKKNVLIMLRPTFGRKKIISEKYRKDGVSFATNFAIGPAIGILKPVYIDYGYYLDPNDNDGPFDYFVAERFDIEQHSNVNNILGRSSFFEGILETTAVIGLHAKYGLDFEYSPYQTGVKGLEAGVMIDAFANPVEIMDLEEIKNKQIYFSFYVNLYFGKKYNSLQ